MHDWLATAVSWTVPTIQAIGVLIVVLGVVEATAALVKRSWPLTRGAQSARSVADIRVAIGRKMVLALEFFIASDIIQTVVVPTWESLGILAGIVAIRTVIAYFLEYEMRHHVAELDGERHRLEGPDRARE